MLRSSKGKDVKKNFENLKQKSYYKVCIFANFLSAAPPKNLINKLKNKKLLKVVPSV